MYTIILGRVQVPPDMVECGRSGFIKEGPCLDEACAWFYHSLCGILQHVRSIPCVCQYSVQLAQFYCASVASLSGVPEAVKKSIAMDPGYHVYEP